jgi:hypothetical protein
MTKTDGNEIDLRTNSYLGNEQHQRLLHAYRLLQTDFNAVLPDLKALAANGSFDAMIYIGIGYERGYGGEKSKAQAERWYRRAAKSGSVESTYHLGRLLYAQRCFEDARSYLARADQAGFAPAKHLLGRMIYLGHGGVADPSEGQRLLDKSYRAGNIFAKASLVRFLMRDSKAMRHKLHGFWLWATSAGEVLKVALKEGPNSASLR